jgi:SAM-dependent methyltransferase
MHLNVSQFRVPFIDCIPESGSILDAGCGPGRDSLYFIQKGFEVDAFDASIAMVKLASKNTGLPVWKMRFQELNIKKKYDGVWACASLLHVPQKELHDVFITLKSLLKTNGILYCSFKWGNGESMRAGRTFTNHTLSSFKRFLIPTGLNLIKHWKTPDTRPERENQFWLNCLCGNNG